MRRTFMAAAALLAATVAPGSAGLAAAPGAWVDAVRPISAPAGGEGFPLPTASPAAAGAAHEAWAAEASGQRMIYNVTRPSLLRLPSGGDAVEPAVILVPGGGFEYLSVDNEGYRVAAKLTALGVRVFILKYRTVPLPDSFDGFHAAIASTFAGRPRQGGPIDIQKDLPDAVADAQAALRAVRAHAAAWGVDPARVGLLGFSAGAMTSLAMTLADAPDARPDFLGLIYGPTRAAVVPAHPPALFDALAADDRFFGKDDLGLIEAWRKTGASVEFHLYSGGGHGFATQPNGTTSDDWFNQFALWLKAQKIIPDAR